ncbi:15018_t:CDS:2 [Acaulospora colombiana]|uniref:15018_t:CDS:1 n=1 Tax=Acaulospora colombiana TaxID=27376 RepID=A0ACA9K7G6_9GLOM|nr:15018_t:CDS:2 [Acaulospora colombiana]
MKILSCEINKVPVTVIPDSGANCNIIEIYDPISKVDVLGIIRTIEISILSQDHKQEQVEVTDIFVTNKPELESVLILGQPWFQENAMKMDFLNKTLTLLNGTDIPVIKTRTPPPTQLNQSVNDYFEKIKVQYMLQY